MPRFDAYRNPNARASHPYYLDVQSDLVTTATRWCIPLALWVPGAAIVTRAQAVLKLQKVTYVLDAPNILAVPMQMLRAPPIRLDSNEHAVVESCIDFMLRGY